MVYHLHIRSTPKQSRVFVYQLFVTMLSSGFLAYIPAHHSIKHCTGIRNSVSQDTGWVHLYSDSKWGGVQYRVKAGICTIQVNVYGIKANDAWKVPLAIPPQHLPDTAFYAPLAHRQSNNVAQLWVPAKSNGDLYLYIYSQVDANWDNYINGVVSYHH